MCVHSTSFLLEGKLKPHTALLVVCPLGQKLGDYVVSLSQLNAVSTRFHMRDFS